MNGFKVCNFEIGEEVWTIVFLCLNPEHHVLLEWFPWNQSVVLCIIIQMGPGWLNFQEQNKKASQERRKRRRGKERRGQKKPQSGTRGDGGSLIKERKVAKEKKCENRRMKGVKTRKVVMTELWRRWQAHMVIDRRVIILSSFKREERKVK